jgi:hypothetical protein
MLRPPTTLRPAGQLPNGYLPLPPSPGTYTVLPPTSPTYSVLPTTVAVLPPTPDAARSLATMGISCATWKAISVADRAKHARDVLAGLPAPYPTLDATTREHVVYNLLVAIDGYCAKQTTPRTAPKTAPPKQPAVPTGDGKQTPPPPPPPPPSCALPTNPKLGQPLPTTDGSSRTSADPYFSTSAERDAWIAANPSCSAPPAWVPDVVVPPSIATGTPADQANNGLATVWMGLPMWAWILAGLGVAGALAAGVVMMGKKPKRSSRRASRSSGARRNPARRRRHRRSRR